MAIFYALMAAIFAGSTSILAKIGLKKINSNLVTALRCVVVILFLILIIFLEDSYLELANINIKVWLFLIFSGLSTGLSWIFYFKALSIGDVNKVVPIDSSSILITILFSWFILGEEFSIIKFCAMVLIFLGILLMINKKNSNGSSSKLSLFYAFLAALFASLSSVFGKIGIAGISSNLGTTIRVFVVLILSWLIVVARGEEKEFSAIDKKALLFIIFSGLTTGFSWLSFYKALQLGNLSSVIVIDKLSILVAMFLSYVFLKEKFTKKSVLGLTVLVAGVIMMLY